jgi:hypothetical protein
VFVPQAQWGLRMVWWTRLQCLSIALGMALLLGAPAAMAETQGQLATRGAKAVRAVPAPAFNWFVNGTGTTADAAAIARTKAAIRKARALNTGASWVCSPAGSGRSSVCQQG